jgi:hypothetical protein
MKRTKSGRKLKYPWPKMKRGDVIGPFDVPDGRNLGSAAAQWSRLNKQGRWQFSTEKTEGGYVITRIK